MWEHCCCYCSAVAVLHFPQAVSCSPLDSPVCLGGCSHHYRHSAVNLKSCVPQSFLRVLSISEKDKSHKIYMWVYHNCATEMKRHIKLVKQQSHKIYMWVHYNCATEMKRHIKLVKQQKESQNIHVGASQLCNRNEKTHQIGETTERVTK